MNDVYAKIYANLIKNNKLTINDVPEKDGLREKVQKLL